MRTDLTDCRDNYHTVYELYRLINDSQARYEYISFVSRDEWELYQLWQTHVFYLLLKLIFNIYFCMAYRRMMFSKSGWLARAGKRKFR